MLAHVPVSPLLQPTHWVVEAVAVQDHVHLAVAADEQRNSMSFLKDMPENGMSFFLPIYVKRLTLAKSSLFFSP